MNTDTKGLSWCKKTLYFFGLALVAQYTMQDCDLESGRIRLSEHEAHRLRRRSAQGIVLVLAAQGGIGVLAALISWAVGGKLSGLSAAIGGGAYFLPNALLALRLLVGLYSGAPASVAVFFVGGAFKLGSALALLAIAVWQFGDWLVWPALLFGLVAVLKGYVLLLASGRLP